MQTSVFFLFILNLALPTVGHAYKFRSVQSTTPNILYGTGTNTDEIEVFSTPEAERNRLFSITYNKTKKLVTRLHLPDIRTTRICEFRRSNGGVIGDYRPLHIKEGLRILYSGGNQPFLRIDDGGHHYGENPVVKHYRWAAWASRVDIQSLGVLQDYCSTGQRSVYMTFDSDGQCRWSTENWHKPGTFPFQMRNPYGSTYFNVRLYCVN